jgi:hypothetical protein
MVVPWGLEALFLAGVFVTLVTACGADHGGEQPSTSTPSAEPTTAVSSPGAEIFFLRQEPYLDFMDAGISGELVVDEKG